MVENSDFAAFARRIMRALARRAGGDVDLLPQLRKVQDDVDELIGAKPSATVEPRATAGLRSPPGSGSPGKLRSSGTAG